VLGLIGFWVFGYEPRGRTFEEIDSTFAKPVPALQRAPAA
jgi:hypothetical protein